jgi:hypothetical protein
VRGWVHVPCMNLPILPRALCALLVLSAACVRADLTILQEISSADNPKSAMMTTTKCKGDKLRIDVAGTASMIIDGKKGGMISLMHQQKVAIPMSQAVQKMASQLAGKATASDPLQLQATGRKETMIGLPCEEYTGTISGQKATVWTTKDVPEYKELSEQFLSLSPQLRECQGPLAGNAALQGFPVLTELTAADGKKTTIRVQAISREAIADAVFKIPDGYRKIEMPQIPGIPAAR